MACSSRKTVIALSGPLAHARKRRSTLLQKSMSREADNSAVLHLSKGYAAVVVDAVASRQRFKEV
jgi:hypothetical protein